MKIDFVIDQNFGNVNVMAWDNLTSIKPIGKAKTISLADGHKKHYNRPGRGFYAAPGAVPF